VIIGKNKDSPYPNGHPRAKEIAERVLLSGAR